MNRGLAAEAVRERQEVADRAHRDAGPVPEGCERIVWFGQSNVPKVSDVPVAQLAEIKRRAATNGMRFDESGAPLRTSMPTDRELAAEATFRAEMAALVEGRLVDRSPWYLRWLRR